MVGRNTFLTLAFWVLSASLSAALEGAGVDPQEAQEPLPVRVCVDPKASPFSLFLPDGRGTVRARLFGSGRFNYSVYHPACDLKLVAISRKSLVPSPKPAGEVWFFWDEYCSRPAAVLEGGIDFNWYHDHGDDRFHSLYLPLGPSTAFEFVEDSTVVAASARPYLFNFVASLSTNGERKRLLKAALAWRSPGACGFVHATVDWSKGYWTGQNATASVVEQCPFAGAPASDGVASVHLPPAKYRKVLLNSVFTLNAPGHNVECYRIWEAAEAGSIPVIVEGAQGVCHRPLAMIEDAPFVFAASLGDAHRTMRELVRDQEALDRRARHVREWYKRYMEGTVARAEARFLERLEA